MQLLLLLVWTLQVFVVQEPYFEYPDDPDLPALEYLVPMGFAMTDPATGKGRFPLHHLRIYGDGRLVLSRFSAKDPFGYETVMLSDSEVESVFLELYEKGVLDFDPAILKSRKRLAVPGVLRGAEAADVLRVHVTLFEPGTSTEKRLIDLEASKGDLIFDTKLMEEGELKNFALAIQALRDRFFRRPP